MDTPTDLELAEVFAIRSLSDALATALYLLEELPDATDVAALWLGDHDGRMLDMIVLVDDRADDVDLLVSATQLLGDEPGAPAQAVVLRSADRIDDGHHLAATYFDRRDGLAAAGVTLLDEVVMAGEHLRSMAITTFTDAPDWDDVSELLLDDLDDPLAGL